MSYDGDLESLGLKEKDCKMLPNNQGFSCENEKAKMVCRIKRNENGDGSVDMQMDCQMEDKTTGQSKKVDMQLKGHMH
jgi:hypothetical protein